MKSKLTSEDMAWLEQRLSMAMAPVQPRAEFVHDAKQALLTLAPDEEEAGGPGWLPVISAGLAGFAFALLVITILRRHLAAQSAIDRG